MGNKTCCCQGEKLGDAIQIQVIRPVTNSIQYRSQEKDRQPINPLQTNKRQISSSFTNPINVSLAQTPIKQINQPLNLFTAQKFDEVPAPVLAEKVKQNIQRLKPFGNELKALNQRPKKYQNLIYQGEFNRDGKPQGYGRMHYPDGSVIIGQFINGQAQGLAYYFSPDGGYYQGKLKDNKANDENGLYFNNSYNYQGGIKDNQMNGKGKLLTKEFTFEGIFQNGKKKSGTYKWKQTQATQLPLSSSHTEIQSSYQYIGDFDENEKFVGQGVLNTPKGVYKGSFKNGKKNGKGIFQYTNKLRYQGNYVDDIRQGKGKLFTKSNTLAYEGDFKDGVPHGIGMVPKDDGSGYSTSEWIYGVNKSILGDF